MAIQKGSCLCGALKTEVDTSKVALAAACHCKGNILVPRLLGFFCRSYNDCC